MGLSTSVLYELIVLANLVLLAVSAAVVVVLLRWALSRWRSIWLKTIAIHAVNLAIALTVVPKIIGFFPILWYAGLTNGSIIDFCILLAIADGARVWAKTQPNLMRPLRGLLPLVLFFAIGALALLAARVSVLPAGKTALEQARLIDSIYLTFAQQSPDREVVDAMRKAFPKDFEAIMKPYVAQVVQDAAAHRFRVLPRFPIDKISVFLKSERFDVARAPDADLARLAKSLSGFGDFLTRNHATCSIEAGGTLAIHMPTYNQPIQQSDGRRIGAMYAAEILAARAGTDHPVDRDISAARAGEYEMLFRSSLPPRLQGGLDDLSSASYEPKVCNIEVLTSHYRWIGSLPAADAANYLALQFSGRQSLRIVALP